MYFTTSRQVFNRLHYCASRALWGSLSPFTSASSILKRPLHVGLRRTTSINELCCLSYLRISSSKYVLNGFCRGFSNKAKVKDSAFNRNKTSVVCRGTCCRCSGFFVCCGAFIQTLLSDKTLIGLFQVAIGETALAFYTATNPTDQAVTGISTYNVVPFEAGQYFNKIQCFCFEEQRLNPREQVDMPVFFYIDPEFSEDPAMAKVDTIILSYTFFEAKEAEKMGL
ncbi:hypothetical protein QZH41_017461 [Actinostola sp. cb2023]|nr:hypothetical protein QZH41_017461 [Actinostola sp. cb2023]